MRVWVAINRRHCKTAGQRGGPKLGVVRSYIRIYASEHCHRQDSNLRSRIRSPLTRIALSCPLVRPFDELPASPRIVNTHLRHVHRSIE